jgi:hypothetical protein
MQGAAVLNFETRSSSTRETLLLHCLIVPPLHENPPTMAASPLQSSRRTCHTRLYFARPEHMCCLLYSLTLLTPDLLPLVYRKARERRESQEEARQEFRCRFSPVERETPQTTDRQGSSPAVGIDYRNVMQCLCGSALADSLDHLLVLNVVGVVSLELGRDTGE